MTQNDASRITKEDILGREMLSRMAMPARRPIPQLMDYQVNRGVDAGTGRRTVSRAANMLAELLAEPIRWILAWPAVGILLRKVPISSFTSNHFPLSHQLYL